MMSMSPQVQAFSQGAPGPDQTESLFTDKFTEMAYGVLYSKFSNIVPYVVTFKIHEVSPEEGRGLGVFILDYEQKPIYIPVVLTDSQLKPMEMFYCKDQNIFLPLTMEWLDEISKMSLDEMGDGAKLPKEVPQDVNIQDLVVPPVTATGRYGYASDEGQWEHDSKRMFKEAEFQGKLESRAFLDILSNHAPQVMLEGVKLAFARNADLLQKFTTNYGFKSLTAAMSYGYARAMTTEKVAAVGTDEGIKVFTKTASSSDLRESFGEKASSAFSQILERGYAVADTRTHIEKVAVRVEGPKFLSSPGPESGWYRLYFSDGKPGIYFVIPFPANMGGRSGITHTSRYGENKLSVPIQYLAISKDGKEAWTSLDIVGEKIFDTATDIKNSKIGKLLNQNKGGGDTISVGSYGFFMNTSPFGMEATEPFRAETVTTDDGIKKIKGEYGCTTYIIDGDPSRKKFDRVVGGSLIYLPNTTKFVQLLKTNPKSDDAYEKVREYQRNQKTSVIKDPKVLLRWMSNILTDKGATPVNVKSAGLNEWWVGRASRALTIAPALQEVAQMYKISAEDAAGILIDAQQHGNSQAVVLDHESGTQVKLAFDKLAQPPMQEGPMSYQSTPGQQQGLPAVGDPSAMGAAGGQEMAPTPGGMDPMSMMQPQPAPSPMSPTDLAIGEAIDGLQQQNQMQQQDTEAQMSQLQQQVSMQQQNNSQLVQVLQGIQDRANQISSATGGQIPAGAEQSPAIAAQALAPVPPQEPPPPPMPMMQEGEMSPDNVAEQINPEMVDQAASFQDSGMFDTAAIAMLAAAPVLQDIVSSYVPNLERGVDNLGRVLLTLWMKEKETKEAVGDEQFISLEDKLRTVFKNLGDVVIALSHNAVNAQTEADRAQEMMQASQR